MKIKNRFLLFLAALLLGLRYNINIKGVSLLDGHKRKLLFLPNHMAFIDPVIMMAVFGSRFGLRPVIDENQLRLPIIGSLIKWFQPFLLPDMRRAGEKGKEETKKTLQKVSEALHKGENVLLYPSGKISYDGTEQLGGSGAAHALLANTDAVPVFVRHTGLWGSVFSRATGHEPQLIKIILQAVFVVLINGIFFVPKRQVEIEVFVPKEKNFSTKQETNAGLEAFYNKETLPAMAYPLYFWQGSSPREYTAPKKAVQTDNIRLAEQADPAIREHVLAYLQEETVQDNITLGMHLGKDLGLDSLTLLEAGLWLDREYGVQINDMSAINTVADVVLLAAGEIVASTEFTVTKAPQAWEKPVSFTPVLEKYHTLPELYIAAAKASPFSVITADMTSGTKTYFSFTTGLFILKKVFQKIDEERVAVLIPASNAAAAAYYGLLFAGKTPVMVNWTHGSGVISQSLARLGVKTIITSRAVLSGLALDESIFTDLELVFLEDVAKNATAFTKAMALARAFFLPSLLLSGVEISQTAAILFTSGSEALPKAVPLTHTNILTNMREIPKIFSFSPTDRIASILPPFHSFGLLLGVAVPYTMGLPVVHYPNPTEGAIIGSIIKEYGITLIAATPTFLHAALRSTAKEGLSSLRLGVVGAEKCPESVTELFAEKCPEAVIIEGYGITECAPLISVNDPENPVPGSLGKVLPCLQHVIVDNETRKPVEIGEVGVLLVQGKNVFQGYLLDAPSPFVEHAGQTWYDTGDMVREDKQGILYFKGRLKRFVKFGGEMISLPAIEAVLNEKLSPYFPAFAAEAAGPDEKPELVVFSTMGAVSRQDINSTLRQSGFSGLYTIKRVVYMDELPLLGTGKTDYQTLKKSFSLPLGLFSQNVGYQSCFSSALFSIL